MFILLKGADINKIRKNYMESQGRRSTQLKGLGEELQGVQKIMYDNIDAVLQRGELLSGKVSPKIASRLKKKRYVIYSSY